MHSFFFLSFKIIFFVASVISAASSLAGCPTNIFTDPKTIQLASDSLMIVTHPADSYDPRLATKNGIELAVRFAQSHNIPVIFLADKADGSASHYFIDQCNPTHWVYSENGELGFNVPARHIYLVGGHLEICLLNSIQEYISRWFPTHQGDFTVTYFMDAIYSNGSKVDRDSAFHNDYLNFITAISYGKAHPTSWTKITLLETMGLIVNESQQLMYAKKMLPFYERWVPTHYRTELKMNNATTQVIQKGKSPQSNRLLFEFLDSAFTLINDNQ
jgi:hypothetical protein